MKKSYSWFWPYVGWVTTTCGILIIMLQVLELQNAYREGKICQPAGLNDRP